MRNKLVDFADIFFLSLLISHNIMISTISMRILAHDGWNIIRAHVCATHHTHTHTCKYSKEFHLGWIGVFVNVMYMCALRVCTVSPPFSFLTRVYVCLNFWYIIFTISDFFSSLCPPPFFMNINFIQFFFTCSTSTQFEETDGRLHRQKWFYEEEGKKRL